MRIAIAFITAVFFCVPSFSARFGIEHVSKLVRVTDPQISPDGKSIVAVVARPNYEENRYDADLVLIDVATAKQHVLTHDRRGVTVPRWSPSRDHLAFLATVAASPQLSGIAMAGGDAAPP